LLWDYIGERLAEGPMELAESHLADCRSCQRELASLRRAHGLIASSRSVPVPPPQTNWSKLRSRLVETPQELPNSEVRKGGEPDYSFGSLARPVTGKSRFTTNLPRIALAGSAAILVFALGAQFGRPLQTKTIKLPSADLRVNHSAPQTLKPADSSTEVATLDLSKNESVLDSTQRRLNPFFIAQPVSNIWAIQDQAALPRASIAHTKNAAESTNRGANGLRDSSSHGIRIPRLRTQPAAAEKSSRIPAKKIQFHPYTIPPGQEAPKSLPANTQMAPNRVVAVSNESDPADGYVMETVRPVSSDDETPY